MIVNIRSRGKLRGKILNVKNKERRYVYGCGEGGVRSSI